MTAISEQAQRAYEANIWKSYLLYFLINFQLWWSIWVLYLTDLRGLSLTQITLLDAVFLAGTVLLAVPAGAVADRFGRKVSLMIGTAAFTGAVLVFGLASSYSVILLSYVTWAFAAASLPGAQHSILFESLKALGREREFQKAAGRQGAIFSFAILAGGLAGAPIADATDLSVPVLLSAAIAAPSLLVVLSMREPPLHEGQPRLAYGRLLRESVRTARRTPTVGTMLIFSSLVATITFGSMIFMQPVLARHDVDVSLFGLLQTPARAVSIVGALIAYRVAASFGLRPLMIVTPVALFASHALLGTWDAVYAFAAFMLVALFNQMLVPVTTDYLNRRIPSNQRATILSLREMLMSLWGVLLQPSLGVVADNVSLLATFWLLAAFSGTVLLLALLLWLRADRREAAAAL